MSVTRPHRRPRPRRCERSDAVQHTVGTIARSGIDGVLIGNTAERILDQVRCSILAVKPADFVSPIGSLAQ